MFKETRFWPWAIVLITLLVILPTLRYFLLDDWIKNKIEEKVHEQSDGIYTLHIGNLQAHFITGNYTFGKLSLKPDYQKWEQLNKKEAPATLAEFKAEQLQIKGLSLLRLLLKKPQKLDFFNLKKPELLLSQMREDSSSSGSVHEQLSGRLKYLQISSLQIDSGFLAIRKKEQNYYQAEIKRLQLYATDLKFDSVAFSDTSRVWYARQINLELDSSDFLMPGGLYRIKTGNTKASAGMKTARALQVKLIPLMSAGEMSKRSGDATTQSTIEIPEVQVKQVNYGEFSRNGAVYIGEILLQKPRISLYKDKQHYENIEDRKLPHSIIRELKNPIAIDKLEIKNMFIRYEELPPKADKTGYITFTGFNASLGNISNIPERMSAEKPATVQASTHIMGKAKFEFSMRFSLLDPNCPHSISGSTGPMELSILNPILEPSSFLHIESGNVSSCNFEVALNCNQAIGEMTVKYQNLKIEMLSDEKGELQGLTDKFKTIAANKLVLKSNNPDDSKLRPGKIEVERRVKRSMFTYWKDCLMAGILSSAGVPKKMQQSM